MASYSASSIPPNPTLRSPTLNTVLIVPLLSSTNFNDPNAKFDFTTHSYQSFQHLFCSLSDVNLERQQEQQQQQQQQQQKPRLNRHLSNSSATSSSSFRTSLRRHTSSSSHNNSSSNKNSNNKQNAAIAAIKAAAAPSNEITLIIPNSNLTPPSGFHYDETPLKSHDWSIGCQRLLFLNGLHSVQAQDRYKSFSHAGGAGLGGSGTGTGTFNNKNKRVPSHYGHFVDLYPSRGIAAVIGVLNVQDCKSHADYKRAEMELQQWVNKFTPQLHYEKSFLNGLLSFDEEDGGGRRRGGSGSGDNYSDDGSDHNDPFNVSDDSSIASVSSPISPRHFVNKRLFLFNSFEERCIKDQILSSNTTATTKDDTRKSLLEPNEIVAFPPMENNMNLHLNVVVNDLAVAIFMSLERRIRVIDTLMDDANTATAESKKYKKKLGWSSALSSTNNQDKKKNDSKKGEERSNVGAVLNLSFGSNDNDDNDGDEEGNEKDKSMLSVFSVDDILTTHSEDDEYYATSAPVKSREAKSNANNNIKQSRGGSLNLKNLAASAVKALNKQSSNNDALDELNLPPIEYELQTPLDPLNFQSDDVTLKDIEFISQRNAARREKHTADLALLAGSVMDAYDRYTSAAAKLKRIQDPLWYAAAIEGIATSFVAMSDTGGHGADLYLETNFQYPGKVMEAALSLTGLKSGDSTKVDKSKTTMPEAVTTLLKEACGIMSRNIKLSSIYSELLLKMAWYISELEALHLLCRWGEGFSGGDGQDDAYGVAMTSAISGQQKRWEMTSVSKIDLQKLQKAGKLDALFSKNTVSQCLRFTQTLHQTASNGGLDAFTRAGVGARCAQLCLKGVKVPQWCSSVSNLNSSFRRQYFPRKAAFFSLLAAESITQCKVPDAATCAAGFWAAASHLYSKEGNKFDSDSAYAWACLRAAVLNGMCLHGGSIASEIATKELIQLLSEITPNTYKIRNNAVKNQDHHNQSKDAMSIATTDYNRKIAESINKSNKPQETAKRKKSTSLPTKSSSSFGELSSQILIHQAEWLNSDAVPLLILPLIEPSTMVLVASELGKIKLMKKNVKNYFLLSPLLSLNCVVHNMKFETCIIAQKRCILHLSRLRTSLSTLSCEFSLHNENPWTSPQTLGLNIKSAKIIKAESHLLMDKLKAAGYVGKMTTSAATFYNPFDKKNKETTGKNIITMVAQGEERTIEVRVGNSLSVPLVMPCCQLAFKIPQGIEIEAPSLSFTIPPKTKDFCVHFPFIVLSSKNRMSTSSSTPPNSEMHQESSKVSFAVTGLRVGVNNRSLYVPFPNENSGIINSSSTFLSTMKQIPDPVSTYKRRSKQHSIEKQYSVDLEAVPAQPNLLISFTSAPSPLEDAATVPVHLSDGEIYTIPSFRLENDFGLGPGTMERLQVVAVGLPGLPEEILFDTDETAKALEEQEDRFSDTDSEEPFDDLMESDGAPPLKMKCSTDGLSLSSINDRSKSLGEGSIIAFQVAATHDMGSQLQNGGNVRIRFRYRGPSPVPGVEIWRKREISLHIIRVKGPRISSLTFRSDLSWGSEYSDLCRSLSLQKPKSSQCHCWEPNEDLKHTSDINSISPPSELIIDTDEKECDYKDFLLKRVGTYSGVFVAKNEMIVLMAVANDTNSTIVLSNRQGVVGGFESSPMPTVRVTSGVSVKIPVVIPRIDCFDANGNIVDIANELIARTALQWETDSADSIDNIGKRIRQGRVRIPFRCLRELIEGHTFFATRVCKPPVTLTLSFNGESCDKTALQCKTGCTIDLKVVPKVYNWVKENVPPNIGITMEFACAKKDSGKSDIVSKNANQSAFIWCGQIRKATRLQEDEKTMQHSARLCFLHPGTYVASACVKISSGLNHGHEEIWWAPMSQTIVVDE